MILKSVNQKCKNKRSAIQFLCSNIDNGIVFNECTLLLNGKKPNGDATDERNGIVYQYQNFGGTQKCKIVRTKEQQSFIYTVSICLTANL